MTQLTWSLISMSPELTPSKTLRQLNRRRGKSNISCNSANSIKFLKCCIDSTSTLNWHGVPHPIDRSLTLHWLSWHGLSLSWLKLRGSCTRCHSACTGRNKPTGKKNLRIHQGSYEKNNCDMFQRAQDFLYQRQYEFFVYLGCREIVLNNISA
jgi:hypothetical protein